MLLYNKIRQISFFQLTGCLLISIRNVFQICLWTLDCCFNFLDELELSIQLIWTCERPINLLCKLWMKSIKVFIFLMARHNKCECIHRVSRTGHPIRRIEHPICHRYAIVCILISLIASNPLSCTSKKNEKTKKTIWLRYRPVLCYFDEKLKCLFGPHL